MDKPLVSILINNYNYGRFLREAIDSALNQTYPHVEVVVVDDGSTDESRDIIASYGDRIKPILKENGGQASAFNAGFAASQGDIICFLDSDDSFKPEKAMKIVEAFTENREVGWCFHPVEIYKNSQEVAQEINEGLSGKYDIRFDIRNGKFRGKLPFNHIVTSGLCFKRSLLEKILPMPEEIRITSDDYLKYVAFSISPGFFVLKLLAQQNIHGDNAYTFKPNNGKLRAKTVILTAYWMKKNFPISSKYSDRLLAYGIAIYPKRNDIAEFECQGVVEDYLSSSTFLERCEIHLRVFAKVLIFSLKR